MSTVTTLSPFPPRVLVVEDEQKTRESVAEGLRLEAWSVMTAATANSKVDHSAGEHGRMRVSLKSHCQARAADASSNPVSSAT